MIVQPSLLGHVKFLRLKKLIGECAAEVLLRLWGYCQQATHGQRLGNASSDDIELLCAWGGTPGALYEALVRSRWIDVNDDGSLCAHGWDEHNAQLRAAWQNGEEKKQRAAEAKAAAEAAKKAASDAQATLPKLPIKGERLILSNLLLSSSEGVQGATAAPPEFQLPSEAEVLAAAAAWPGDMARAIPGAIPEAWVLGWLNYRLRDPSRFPGDWQGDMTRSFVRDWVKGLPDARGSTVPKTKTPFALKTQLDALEIRIKEHPGNPDSNSCSGDPSEQATEDFRELKRSRAELVRKLSEGV